MENKFEKLTSWQKAHELVILVYKITKKFPVEEKYSLIDQLRRATVSVAANIAEGNLHQSKKELIKFLFISKASLEEVKYYLLLSKDLGYLSNDLYVKSESLSNECGRLISGFIRYLKSNS